MEAVMETISSKDVRDHLSDVLNDVAFKGRKYTLTRSGKGIAVILSLEEWNQISEVMQKFEDQRDIQDAER